MSKEAVVKFLEQVSEDEEIESTLRTAVEDKPDRSARIVAFASERGFEFTEAEFDEVLDDGRRSLTDDQLESIVGGTAVPNPYAPQLSSRASFVFPGWLWKF